MTHTYSIVLWLNASPHHQDAPPERTKAPGASTHVFNPPAADRIVYGHYNTRDTAELALGEIEERLGRGVPLRVTHDETHGGTTFLIASGSVYYVVMAAVTRPTDAS